MDTFYVLRGDNKAEHDKLERDIEDTKARIREFQDALKARQDVVVTLLDRKQKLKPLVATEYNKKDCEQLLRKYPNYRKNSFEILGGTIRFRFRDVKMTVDLKEVKLPAASILYKGPVEIPLGEIECQIDYERPVMRFYKPAFAYPKKSKFLKRFHAGYAHPHIVADNQPCMGEHAAALLPELDNFDLDLIFVYALRFLSSCNPKDPAGKTWIRWIANQVEGNCAIDVDSGNCYINVGTRGERRLHLNLDRNTDGTLKYWLSSYRQSVLPQYSMYNISQSQIQHALSQYHPQEAQQNGHYYP